jgi:hypothetical protein
VPATIDSHWADERTVLVACGGVVLLCSMGVSNRDLGAGCHGLEHRGGHFAFRG